MYFDHMGVLVSINLLGYLRVYFMGMVRVQDFGINLCYSSSFQELNQTLLIVIHRGKEKKRAKKKKNFGRQNEKTLTSRTFFFFFHFSKQIPSRLTTIPPKKQGNIAQGGVYMKLTPYSRPLSDVKHVRKFHFSFFFPGRGYFAEENEFSFDKVPLGYTKNFFGCFKFSFLTHGRKLGRGRERETDVYIYTHTHRDPGTNKTNPPGVRLSTKPNRPPCEAQYERKKPRTFSNIEQRIFELGRPGHYRYCRICY